MPDGFPPNGAPDPECGPRRRGLRISPRPSTRGQPPPAARRIVIGRSSTIAWIVAASAWLAARQIRR